VHSSGDTEWPVLFQWVSWPGMYTLMVIQTWPVFFQEVSSPSF